MIRVIKGDTRSRDYSLNEAGPSAAHSLDGSSQHTCAAGPSAAGSLGRSWQFTIGPCALGAEGFKSLGYKRGLIV